MRKYCLMLIVALSALLLASAPVAAADGQGTIQGVITNGTQGGVMPPALNLFLTPLLDGDAQEVIIGQSQPDGAFSFTGLETGPGYTYEIEVTYEQVTYRSGELVFAEGETLITSDITVYDTTEDISVLAVGMQHVIVYTSGEDLTVRELYFLANLSDTVFTGLLYFEIPADAAASDMAASLVWTTMDGSNAVLDSVPIPPGMREISFSYTIPAGSKYALSRRVPLAMDQFNLLVEGGTLTIQSDQLFEDEPLDISGTTFSYYLGGPLQAGETLDIVLVAPGAGNQLAVWLTVGGIIVLAAAGYFYFRTRRNQPAPAYTGIDAVTDDRREELLQEMADLDDRLEAGTISEEEYRTVRDQIKAELKDLLRGETTDRDGE